MRFLGKVAIYSVKTGSMEDNIHAGDYVLIWKKKEYHVNDVITFKKEDYLVTHRIVSIEDDKFITKGDANNTEDEVTNYDNIVGKVMISGGILNYIIKYKYYFIIIFVLIYIVSFCLDTKDEKKEMEVME